MTLTSAPHPQLLANDPKVSAFVTANAGSGKTSTLVGRVARLLLRGARPEAILCLTFTKAAAAEMQRRLFETLGQWALQDDAGLAKALEALDEQPGDLSRARRLFAQALETPGGLKIQTIHAFCEKLLRRFPLEAGVSPGFIVLEDAAAQAVSTKAREALAQYAIGHGPLAQAYASLSVALDYKSFNALLVSFESQRHEIEAFVKTAASQGGIESVVWKSCGFSAWVSPETLEAQAVAGIDWNQWYAAASALILGQGVQDLKRADKMMAVNADSSLALIWACLSTENGAPTHQLAKKGVDPGAKAYLELEQDRLEAWYDQVKAAQIAQTTVQVISLAEAYARLYELLKAQSGGMDFGDLILAAKALLTEKSEAAWVLFKLDGGIDHVLVDEAQDTAPQQWDIIRALTGEFFAGHSGLAGDGDQARTMFAVGDEKQSIFSFQGADPTRLLEESQFFAALAEGAQQPFRGVSLTDSWRSTPEVLNFVDAVFADAAASQALSPPRGDGDGTRAVIQHIALRPPGLGTVDIWPLEVSPPKPELDPWAPLDTQGALPGANKALALKIAQDIQRRVQGGEAVFDKVSRLLRPAVYGDFLILVRRRAGLFEEIIRALKRLRVPVGGADRLTLSDHVAFKDLVALAQFCLYTDDDLTLAALLRSPLCDLDEQDLFDLAYQRRGSLWAALSRRAQERPAWLNARKFLGWARSVVTSVSPFDFYAQVLSRLDQDGRAMRQRILSRLGREAEEALDAFLAQALAAEARGIRDLERFVDAMASLAIEVKREQEDGKGEVRVMTAHGAKGLEAPIVYLPDTATKAKTTGSRLMTLEDGGLLWAPSKPKDIAPTKAARARREALSDEESLRLLYVAMTRARDQLVICGVEPGKPASKIGSWYDLIERGLEQDRLTMFGGVRELPMLDGVLRRYGADPVLAKTSQQAAAPLHPLPDWARTMAPIEGVGTRYASPSMLAEQERGPAPSPLASLAGLGRYRRGDLIHKLLQLLPDLDPARYRQSALALLAREPDLTPAQCEEMTAAALGVLTDPVFAEVFGPGSRPEVAVAGTAPGLPAGLAVSGRVDRLVITPDRVLVVDYKTNRPAPLQIEHADRAYLVQMAVYVAVLRQVFPGRHVEAALVWTDGPLLMPVPSDLVEQTLAGLERH